MTGGRAYLYDPTGRHTAALDVRSVAARPARHRRRGSSRRPGPRRRARRAPRSAPRGRLGARRAPAPRRRPGGARLAGRADRDAGARGHATGRVARPVDAVRSPPPGRRPCRIATRPQPHRSRTGADAGGAGRYLRANMGQRHPRVIGPCVPPIPGTPARKVSPMIHPSDSKAGSAIRRPRRPRRAGHVCRLRLPPDARRTTPASTSTRSAGATPAAAGSPAPMPRTTSSGRPIAVAV